MSAATNKAIRQDRVSIAELSLARPGRFANGKRQPSLAPSAALLQAFKGGIPQT
jgi:hypothetical protein